MLTVPSFQEEPEPVIELLKAYAAMDGESPAELLERQEAERLQETDAVLSALGWRPSGCDRPRTILSLDAAVDSAARARAAQAGAALQPAASRRAGASASGSWHAGRLASADDVFYLTAEEFELLSRRRRDVPRPRRTVIALRRRRTPSSVRRRRRTRFELQDGEYFDRAGERVARPDVEQPAGTSDRRRRLRRADNGECRDPARRHRIAQAHSRRHPGDAPDGSRLGTDFSAHLRSRHRTRRNVVARRDHRARVRHPLGGRRQGRNPPDSSWRARSSWTAIRASSSVGSCCDAGRLPPRTLSAALFVPLAVLIAAAVVSAGPRPGRPRARLRFRAAAAGAVPRLGRPRRPRARSRRASRTASSYARRRSHAGGRVLRCAGRAEHLSGSVARGSGIAVAALACLDAALGGLVPRAHPPDSRR